MTDLAQALQQAVRHHQAGRLSDARGIYERILAAQPDQADALNLMGMLAQQTGQLDEAEDYFTRAIASSPDTPGIRVNYGNLLRTRGDHEDAEAAYRRALELKPDAHDARNNLGVLYEEQGRLEDAERAYRAALQHNPRYPEALNNLGSVLHKQGRIDAAIDAYRQALELNRGYANAWSNLSTALQDRGELHEAELAMGHALKLRPDWAEAWFNLGNLYDRKNDLDRSVAALRQAIRAQPDFVDAHRHLAGQLTRIQRFAEAERHNREALRIAPQDARAWNDLGLTLNGDNRLDKAEAAYRKALSLDPGSTQALGNLAKLLEQTNRTDEARDLLDSALLEHADEPMLNIIAARMERRRGENQAALRRLSSIDLAALPTEGAGRAHHELGLVLDRLERPDEAWSHFEKANGIVARETANLHIDKQTYVDQLSALDRQLDADLARQWQDDPLPPAQTDPVFLVGFPRSGTTLLEVALNNHPRLVTLEEKPFTVSADMLDLPTPGALELGGLDRDRALRLREQYETFLDEHVPARGDRIVIDKLPLRIVDAAMLWRLFPESRWILALRHPADAVLSCFMQDFQPNIAMANFNDLQDAARLYDRVMSLWEKTTHLLPVKLHAVRYEDVVEDFEQQLRQLLDFLGLQWDDAVLRYRDRAQRMTRIHTPSYHQVTEPIYTRARFRWERYRKQLGPVMDTLQPWIEHWGYGG